jgi:hypothetical protein
MKISTNRQRIAIAPMMDWADRIGIHFQNYGDLIGTYLFDAPMTHTP